MKMRNLLIGGALGAAMVYFLDPEQGRGRRARLRDQVGARIRDSRRSVERSARQFRDRAWGAVAQLEATPSAEPEDDLTILSRVESVLFGMPGFPKHTVNAEVVEGELTLRGEVMTEEDARAVVEAASRVRGVVAVQSLLHLPGQEAPNKAASRHAGE